MSNLSFRKIEGDLAEIALVKTGVGIIAASAITKGETAYLSAHGHPFSYLVIQKPDQSRVVFEVSGGTKEERRELLKMTRRNMEVEEGGSFQPIQI